MNIIGMRVEMPAYSDQWMQGDRYGEIVSTFKSRKLASYVLVKLDKSGRSVRVHMDALQPIG
jgi:hypothetical protein